MIFSCACIRSLAVVEVQDVFKALIICSISYKRANYCETVTLDKCQYNKLVESAWARPVLRTEPHQLLELYFAASAVLLVCNWYVT